MTEGLATRHPGRLVADPARVLAQLFVPGHALPGGREGRATGIVAHVLELGDDEVSSTLEGLLQRFAHRHRDLPDTFRRNAERIRNRLSDDTWLSEERWLLLGASFTHEYSVEAAALCNPSVVPDPDQSSAPSGGLRFVMSVRQIGEGHRSSIGFRTGVLDGAGGVALDPPAPFSTAGASNTGMLPAGAFAGLDQRPGVGAEAVCWVLGRLGSTFPQADLDAALAALEAQADTRRNVAVTVAAFREVAARSYEVEFAAETELGERVLFPFTPSESNGMEDARFVRFVADDGVTTYHASYTAYDGSAIAQQLLTTSDFRSFSMAPLTGAAAANKGLALFPRRIGGRYAAMSRFDGAHNAIAFTDDLHYWPKVEPLAADPATWEAIQVGNCGSPLETNDGWLVLTHGVGPMRTYSIGAMLLDLDDPTRVIGRLKKPLFLSSPDEQDGYVPNVVYTCGGLVHGATLFVPYGINDGAIGLATVPLPELVATMRRDGPPASE